MATIGCSHRKCIRLRTSLLSGPRWDYFKYPGGQTVKSTTLHDRFVLRIYSDITWTWTWTCYSKPIGCVGLTQVNIGYRRWYHHLTENLIKPRILRFPMLSAWLTRTTNFCVSSATCWLANKFKWTQLTIQRRGLTKLTRHLLASKFLPKTKKFLCSRPYKLTSLPGRQDLL